ncbi:MGMT family protein [Candidatus Saccharibacteria bacterium]|nr:MGMT family protein [Candidatus Saccharibacteria bacterium]
MGSGFQERIYALVAQIPKGKVTTYGRLAAWCGSPRAARIVGGIAHFGDTSLPWQRVVKADGSLAEGYPGGAPGHQRALEAEKVEFHMGKVRLTKHLWDGP